MKIFTDVQGRIRAIHSTDDTTLTEHETDLLDGMKDAEYKLFMFSFKTQDGKTEIEPLIDTSIIEDISQYISEKFPKKRKTGGKK